MSQLLRGRYRREAILRQGEATITILARDTKTDRLCVVKSLHLPSENTAELLRLVQRESRAYAALSDPRIPQLIDGFPHQEAERMSYVLVTEYVEGRDLARVVHEGGVYGEAQALALLRSLAELLAELHSRQPRLAHRGVRPEKVIVDPAGVPHLVDFGSWSRAMRRLLGPEGAQAPPDPRGYSPPEDLAGDAVPASDVYALGATVAFALTGKDPAELGAGASAKLPVSRRLRRVLRRMLAEKVELRYADAGQVLRALDEPTLWDLLLDRRVSTAAAATLALTVLFLGWPARPPVAPAITQSSIVPAPTPAPLMEPTDPPFREPSPRARPSGEQQVTESRPPRDPPRRSSTPAPPPEVALPAVWARDGRLSIDLYRDFKYVAAGWPGGLAPGQTNATALDTRPQERLRAEPRYASPSVLYGCLKLGNGPDPLVTFVLDELEHPTWAVWVDKNNNQDLTDDGPPLANQGSGLQVAANLSLEIDVVSRGSAERRPYKIWLWVNEVPNAPPGASRYAARFYAVCHYAGRVELLGEVFDAVAFEERGHDGLFGENGIWIDLDRNGKFQPPGEHFLDGKEIRTGRGWWTLRLEHP